jgi:hypothetical protein
MMIVTTLFGCIVTIVTIMTSSTTHPYDLPVLPTRQAISQAVSELNDPMFATALALSINNASSFGIPKIFWTTMKIVPSSLNPFNLSPREQLFEHPWIAETCERNPTWTYHMVDDDRVGRFFTTVFANTSVLWAFQMINPALGTNIFTHDD